MLQWFKSYLNNRKQYVFISGESSHLKEVSCGVPQGSVLGPLLFLLYINDLPNISNVFQFFLFADDTNIYLQSDSPEQLEYDVNNELKKLHSWLIVNRLSLNLDKTNFVTFHPYNKPMKHKITLKFNKKAIPQKSAIKCLGVMLDSTLTWHAHVDLRLKKISRAIGLMYKNRPFVNSFTLCCRSMGFSRLYSH